MKPWIRKLRIKWHRWCVRGLEEAAIEDPREWAEQTISSETDPDTVICFGHKNGKPYVDTVTMKPEEKVVAKLKRELNKAARQYGFPCLIDKPPATRFNSNGRPDLFVDFGPFHFRIEVKADKNKKLSALQEDYVVEREAWNPYLCHAVKGMDGVEEFMAGLPDLLRAIHAWNVSLNLPTID